MSSPRPRVLVTPDLGTHDRKGVAFPILFLKTAYLRAVDEAGGLPQLMTPTDRPEIIDAFAAEMDALVVTGGAFDIPPEAYGQMKRHRVDAAKPLRTELERALLLRALERDVPVLGICGGMQLLNVVLGGTLLQDIAAEVEGALEHEQPTSPAAPHHPVVMEPGSPFFSWVEGGALEVNSTHHQAVDRIADDLEIFCRSSDGVVEGVYAPARRFVVGVQWHPELLDDPFCNKLYGALVEAALRSS